MNVAWRFSKHAYYKKLCACASLGELSAEGRDKLNRHLKSCAACSKIYVDYADINAALTPEVSDDEEIIAGLEASTRTAVLESIAACERETKFKGEPTLVRSAAESTSPSSRSARARVLRWSAASALAVFFFALGARYETFQLRRAYEVARSTVQKPISPVARPTEQKIQAQLSQATAMENQLSGTLESERQRKAALQATLDVRNKQLATVETVNAALREQIAAREQDLANTRVLLTSKSAELERVEESANADKATLIELKYKVQELTEKANLETADLQRERDLLLKGREIRDIVGARNLHIVDVYDAGAKGHTKRPFARAFYTEGKSLVFYAYDLPGEYGDPKLTYVAWGQRNGTKSSIRNLGILINDDQAQRRWSLNFNDPHVLAEIDSVFITLEPSGDSGQPSGKRMLTAYLNDAVNHP